MVFTRVAYPICASLRFFFLINLIFCTSFFFFVSFPDRPQWRVRSTRAWRDCSGVGADVPWRRRVTVAAPSASAAAAAVNPAATDHRRPTIRPCLPVGVGSPRSWWCRFSHLRIKRLSKLVSGSNAAVRATATKIGCTASCTVGRLWPPLHFAFVADAPRVAYPKRDRSVPTLSRACGPSTFSCVRTSSESPAYARRLAYHDNSSRCFSHLLSPRARARR